MSSLIPGEYCSETLCSRNWNRFNFHMPHVALVKSSKGPFNRANFAECNLKTSHLNTIKKPSFFPAEFFPIKEMIIHFCTLIQYSAGAAPHMQAFCTKANDLVDLTGSRRRALFLNFCGKQMFDTARALLAPQPLNSVTWKALMAKLKNHYAPTASRIAQRHAFHRHEQAEGETFKELDDALLDRLVCGLKDLQIQCRLLAKPDLMLQLALDEACTVELSNKSMVEIHGATSPVSGEKP
ncbi:hypothetical protein E2320_017543 [Naja naja]|nr:hypothetical protein E2320_017543 [Naja naja]